MCEITGAVWSTVCAISDEWRDSVSELHGLTTASFLCHVLNCIVANSHCIPYIIKLEYRTF